MSKLFLESGDDGERLGLTVLKRTQVSLILLKSRCIRFKSIFFRRILFRLFWGIFWVFFRCICIIVVLFKSGTRIPQLLIFKMIFIKFIFFVFFVFYILGFKDFGRKRRWWRWRYWIFFLSEGKIQIIYPLICQIWGLKFKFPLFLLFSFPIHDDFSRIFLGNVESKILRDLKVDDFFAFEHPIEVIERV